jgi:hypothetical protein
MIRQLSILLTIWGILACPMVCREEWSSPRAPALPAHCGPRPHEGCHAPSGTPDTPTTPSGDCGMHGCICSGAVNARPDVSGGAQPEPFVWVGLPRQSLGQSIGSASSMDVSAGRFFVPVCSGREVRVLLASLVI